MDQLELNFDQPNASDQQPERNGMYYEQSTDRFVSFVLGRRHYEMSAQDCIWPKAWQDKTKKERSI